VIHADDRGEGWDANACKDPTGIFMTLLEQVPYNTSAAWISAYPDLPNILNDTPCRAKYNIIQGNTVCSLLFCMYILHVKIHKCMSHTPNNQP